MVNNLLFVVFAFVVLLGTVFPLLYEAFRGQQVTVGAPYFNAMTLPIGLALLFLMSIGPALPWRKTTAGTLSDRLTVPAWVGVLVVVACVAGGVRGLGPLVAFGLGGFAAAANARQLVLSARAAHRSGAGVWRGLVGRANGGMVVHLGVVVIAVALAAATSFGHRSEVTLRPGQVVSSRRPSHQVHRPHADPDAGPDRHRGPRRGGRARPAPSRREPVRAEHRGGRDARHRLEPRRRRVPDLGRRARHGGRSGHDRGHGAAARGLAVGRRASPRARVGAGGRPRPASASHRPGLGAGAGGRGR